jgi:hypothetical protein
MSQENKTNDEFEKAREEVLYYWNQIVAVKHKEIELLTSKLAELNVDAIEKDYDIPLAIVEAIMSIIAIYTNIRDYDQTKYVMWSLIEWCIEEIKFFNENGYWRFLEINQ